MGELANATLNKKTMLENLLANLSTPMAKEALGYFEGRRKFFLKEVD